jgi:hypothetical protein
MGTCINGRKKAVSQTYKRWEHALTDGRKTVSQRQVLIIIQKVKKRNVEIEIQRWI